MIKDQIDKLLLEGEFPEMSFQKELVETHISWVILCKNYVYKIKKPIKYSFLDFSTLELRRYFCLKELELNQRLTKNIYLGVLPIYELKGAFKIGGDDGILIDYTLKMLKMDPQRQMDVLLKKDGVSTSDIQNLAKRIADFHKNTVIVYKKDVLDIQEKFNDLETEKEFLSKNLGVAFGDLIDNSITTCNTFLQKNKKLLKERLNAGFFKDCHGDLHTRNIFLLHEPQPFDCIEFNDDFRQIDVLNEVAFLCMDLEALKRSDLSELFMKEYNILFPSMRNDDEHQLFIFYKCYRANVRAKVNSLRAKGASEKKDKTKSLMEAKKYLMLMQTYLEAWNIPK